MRKVFVFLVVAIVIFGYKVLSTKSAEYPCSCSVTFGVKNTFSGVTTNEECLIRDAIMVDSKSTVSSIAQQINAACNEIGDTPEPIYVSQLAEEILDGFAECPRESANKSPGTNYGFSIRCMQDLTVPVETPVEKAPAGKSAKDLKTDAASRLNPAGLTVPAELIGRFIKMLTAFIGSIALALYIYSGFLWMTASGNTEKVTKAKSIMVWTTLGVVVMLASYMLVSFVFNAIPK